MPLTVGINKLIGGIIMSEKITVIRKTEEILVDMERLANEANAVLKEKDESVRDGIALKYKSKIDAYAKEYKSAAEHEYYVAVSLDAIAKGESAMENIIKEATFFTKIGVIEYDEVTGIASKVVLVKKPVRIDLSSFDRVYSNVSEGKKSSAHDERWVYAVSKLNQIFCLDRAAALGLQKSIIEKTYYLKEKAKEIELGKTPTSNTKLLAQVQDTIDMIIYSENKEKGGNSYKVRSQDVAYLKTVYAKISNKEELTVTVMNDRRFTDALVRSMKRILTGGRYGIDGYKVIKED